MSRQYINAQVKRLQHPPNWIRINDGGEAYLKSLWESYAARPLYPLICVPSGDWLEVWDGNLRLDAARRFSPQGEDTELPVCIVTGEPVSPSLSLEVQLDSASHTRDLSDYEYFVGYSEWLAINPNATAKDVAERTHRDKAVVSKLLSLGRCVDAVKDAARAGLLGYTKWHQLSQMQPEEQVAAVANGATREELQRSRRNGNGQSKAATVKVSTIPVLLTGGIAVTFRAEGLTLTMALDAVAELKQALKEGIDFDHDARTFAVLMKKRARELAQKG